MRILIASLCALLLANSAVAQNAPAATSTTQPSQSEVLTNQLQQLLKTKNQQEALTRALAMSTLLGCAGQMAGTQATNDFYKQMQDVGKQVGDLCKAQQPDQARALVLSTMKANQYNRVVMAINNCYARQKSQFDTMAGPELANDAARYNRWIRDPHSAEREMQNGDICK